ncbi:vitamin K epoxide reductase family protein [Azospirillum halopraeferens]|uniref:vitamin K epoxide reductase family protein n=1 Tax=Azospirillum halopraeferens TaxID=34010 RepID=UPI0003FDD782|nr:vitamin K epoxide reductase family protein [Azospirillum halopraeferens]
MHDVKQAMHRTLAGPLPPQDLRRRIRRRGGTGMALRRATVATSLIGMASMAAVTLYQTGLLRRLPDPPVRRPHFDTAKVNSSDEAWGYGMPDGPITLAMHAGNLMLAAAGPPERVRTRPWLPMLAAVFAGAQAAVAAKYLFHTMPKVDRAWCPYCVTDALMHFGTFAFTLTEAAQAAESLRAARQPPRGMGLGR